MDKFKKIKWVYANVTGIKKIFIMIISFSIFISVLEIISPMIISLIIDEGIIGKNFDLLIRLVAIYFIIILFNYFLGWIIRKIEILLGNRVFEVYSKKIFSNLFNKEGSYYTNYSVGDVLTLFFQDIFSIKSFFTQSVSMFFLNILVSIVVLIRVFFINVPLGVIITCNLIIVLVYQLHTQKKAESLFEKSKQSYIRYNDFLQNVLSNLMNVLSLGINKKLKNKNSKLLYNFINSEKNIAYLYTDNSICIQILSNIPIIAIYGYGGYLVTNNSLSVGIITSVILYYQNLFSPLMKAINTRNLLQEGFLSIERVQAFLSTANRDLLVQQKILPSQQSEGQDIIIDNITFSYGDKKVIDNISIALNKGDINFVVGKSGSGKSSLLKLIYRLWDVDSGIIRVNGIDISTLDIEAYRDNISYITQNIHIFNDTIRNNILLDNSVNDEQLNEVLKIVELEEMIETLPDGIDSKIGVEGNNFSGGQLQRIAIARELIANKPILLLDEFTNSLDKITENKIINNIINYCQGKTIVIVSHHLDITLLGDKVFVLNNGKISEADSPDNLLKMSGEYVALMKTIQSNS